MVIAMRQDCHKGEVAQVIAALRARGLEPRLVNAGSRVILGVVEEMSQVKAQEVMEEFQGLAGVEEIHRFDTSWKLVSKSFSPEPTVIRLGRRAIGGGGVLVMAGPCAVEGRREIIEIAQAVAEAGAGMLRGGAFKPRSSPYSFRGLGEKGLEYLAEAREITGLPVVTEVLTPEEVPLVARYADVLQVGARNMQNFYLLEAVGESDRPVLLKRGLMATIQELLLSAEYIVARGNWQVMLCERGIRTFETETRNTLDIAAVPVLKGHTHLPVVVDPSHAAGKRELVPAMARAAVAAGADGLMVEVHPEPDKAFSDGRQSLTIKAFAEMMRQVEQVSRVMAQMTEQASMGAAA
jgi:3-deoxy-7-phosphoheptulonate synthase